eukprot:TRINITY_DN11657_c0_g1_i1.p3 TRINITY_DN11657_c0_g1~~TRINITY_DN11657_c0_g1_i1.p3  ORF type:complete len:258 (+),score=58.79 TRINITY_DN11657_c0_g1_i1:109-774(+)
MPAAERPVPCTPTAPVEDAATSSFWGSSSSFWQMDNASDYVQVACDGGPGALPAPYTVPAWDEDVDAASSPAGSPAAAQPQQQQPGAGAEHALSPLPASSAPNSDPPPARAVYLEAPGGGARPLFDTPPETRTPVSESVAGLGFSAEPATPPPPAIGRLPEAAAAPTTPQCAPPCRVPARAQPVAKPAPALRRRSGATEGRVAAVIRTLLSVHSRGRPRAG